MVMVGMADAAVDSRQTHKRKRKHLSSQTIGDSKSSPRTSSSAGQKQHSNIGKARSKKLNKDRAQSAKDSVTVPTGSSTKKFGLKKEKKEKRKHRRNLSM